MKRSRCANGFRKDKDIVCVKKSIRVKRSRCANGFRKDRVCVKKRAYDNENKIVGNKITIKKEYQVIDKHRVPYMPRSILRIIKKLSIYWIK